MSYLCCSPESTVSVTLFILLKVRVSCTILSTSSWSKCVVLRCLAFYLFTSSIYIHASSNAIPTRVQLESKALVVCKVSTETFVVHYPCSLYVPSVTIFFTRGLVVSLKFLKIYFCIYSSTQSGLIPIRLFTKLVLVIYLHFHIRI